MCCFSAKISPDSSVVWSKRMKSDHESLHHVERHFQPSNCAKQNANPSKTTNEKDSSKRKREKRKQKKKKKLEYKKVLVFSFQITAKCTKKEAIAIEQNTKKTKEHFFRKTKTKEFVKNLFDPTMNCNASNKPSAKTQT